MYLTFEKGIVCETFYIANGAVNKKYLKKNLPACSKIEIPDFSA